MRHNRNIRIRRQVNTANGHRTSFTTAGRLRHVTSHLKHTDTNTTSVSRQTFTARTINGRPHRPVVTLTRQTINTSFNNAQRRLLPTQHNDIKTLNRRRINRRILQHPKNTGRHNIARLHSTRTTIISNLNNNSPTGATTFFRHRNPN